MPPKRASQFSASFIEASEQLSFDFLNGRQNTYLETVTRQMRPNLPQISCLIWISAPDNQFLKYPNLVHEAVLRELNGLISTRPPARRRPGSNRLEADLTPIAPLRLKHCDLRIERLGLGDNVGVVLSLHRHTEIELRHFLRMAGQRPIILFTFAERDRQPILTLELVVICLRVNDLIHDRPRSCGLIAKKVFLREIERLAVNRGPLLMVPHRRKFLKLRILRHVWLDPQNDALVILGILFPHIIRGLVSRHAEHTMALHEFISFLNEGLR